MIFFTYSQIGYHGNLNTFWCQKYENKELTKNSIDSGKTCWSLRKGILDLVITDFSAIYFVPVKLIIIY